MLAGLLLVWMPLGWGQSPSPAADLVTADPNLVTLIRVEGAISPTTTSYVRRAVSAARAGAHRALIMEMDTPGGLLDSTKDIVQIMLDSDDLPIIVYVAPQGASAASAGTFITMAAHVAAMAPATNIGAASPVQLGGSTPMDPVLRKKLFHHAESYIKSIAERRKRNAEWAVSAVRDGESITAERAVELNVVDMIATSREDLLEKLDGRELDGKILRVRDATIVELSPSLAERLLTTLIQPEVILILTMVAVYGIIGELTSPGAIIPGVAGVIALVLVLFASAVIPINTAGLVLVALAVVLFIAEAFTPAFGILIAGGTVSFLLGALMLFQDLPESMSISWEWLIPSTIFTAVFFALIVYKGIRVQLKGTSSTGVNAMVGQRARVVDEVGPKGGRVFVLGEYWNARSEETIPEGEHGEIVAVDGLMLTLRRVGAVSGNTSGAADG